MPLLVEMTCSFRNMISMHNVKYFISYSLSISCALPNESQSVPNKVRALKKFKAVSSFFVTDSKLVLLA